MQDGSIVDFLVRKRCGSVALVGKERPVMGSIISDVVSGIFGGVSGDVMMLDNCSVGVEEIRGMLAFLQYRSAAPRLVVVDLVRANDRALAALLKITEEPPKNVLLMMLAPNAGGRFATLMSRCMVFRAGARSVGSANLGGYRYFLFGSMPWPSSYEEILGAVRLLASRVLSGGAEELLEGERAVVEACDACKFLCGIEEVLEFIHRAEEMRLEAASVAVSVRSMLLKGLL